MVDIIDPLKFCAFIGGIYAFVLLIHKILAHWFPAFIRWLD